MRRSIVNDWELQTETCAFCRRTQRKDLALHPESGWDWFHQVRLCPRCAATDKGKHAIAKAKEDARNRAMIIRIQKAEAKQREGRNG